jgi:hypothetical protein
VEKTQAPCLKNDTAVFQFPPLRLRLAEYYLYAENGGRPSAAMLRDRRAYDQALERLSDSILPFIRHDLELEEGMVVHNETACLYRYFDAAAQAEYLYQCIEETIHRDLRDEIGFLAVFDAALRAVLNIVDMPIRRASLLARFILQNKGRLSKGTRTTFSEISDQEIDRIEKAV